MTLDTLLAKRTDLEAELQEALHDQRFYAEAQESDPVLSPHNSEYLRACREVDRITDRLQALDEKIDFYPC
jgi:hypothetical protein